MSQLIIHHLSGPRRGASDHVIPPAALGSDPSAQVPVPGAAPHHARILERDGQHVLQDAGSGFGTLLAGESVQEAVLRDGDVVELGVGGPRLCIRRADAADAALPQPPRRKSAGGGRWDLLGWALLEEGGHRTSRSFRVTLFAAVLAGALAFSWSHRQSRRLQEEVARLTEAVRDADSERERFEARIEEERRRTGADRTALQTRLEEYRRRVDELNDQLSQAASDEGRSLRDELSVTRSRLATLESERAAGERIIRDYGAGVALIQGSYAFYDSEGRPLRYRVDEAGQALRGEDGNLTLGTSEKGPVHTVDYFGTGFLVDRGGLLLTNRHVAEPWWKDDTAQTLGAEGFAPRFVLFRAFFPRQQEPFELEVERHAAAVDLSLVRLELRGRRIPVLPLDRSGQGAVAGQPVVVVGYPTGLEAILAKAESSVVQGILQDHGMSSERVAEALGRQGLIRPSTTQGHIGDVTRSDIVFDASTTQGGSGGPVFNRNGQVVAVEYAVLSGFRGNSFGVPISYALELLAPPRRKG
jgi:S1-C subfamily serine protease